MDKIKTLSAAIRYGSTLKPQGRGALIVCAAGQPYKTCALGAAWDAIRAAKGEPLLGLTDVCARTRAAVEALSDVGLYVPDRIVYEVVLRNDSEQWTREAIADWLAEEGL